SETEIELRTTATYRSYNYKEQKIVIKKDKDGFFVKCLTCSTKSKTLCSHQMALLTKAQHALDRSGFLGDSFDYQNIVAVGVKNTGVHPDAFDKYFCVIFDPSGFSISPLAENMVNPDWIKSAQKMIDVPKENRKASIQYQTAKLEEGRQKKFAFLWFDNPHEQEYSKVNLRFVQGYGLKTKEGIHATERTIEKLPSGFPPLQTDLGRLLFFACQEQDPAIRFQQFKNAIEDNTDTLNEIYQYVYKGHPEYGTIKASDLFLIAFNPSFLQCKFSIKRKDGLVHLTRDITLDGQPFDYKKIIFSNAVFSATNNAAYLHPNYRFQEFMDLFHDKDAIILPYTNKQDYTKLINGFKQYFEVAEEPGLTMEEQLLTNPQYQILLREVGTFVLFEPRLKYGEYSFNAFDEDSYYINKKIFKVDDTDRLFLIDFLKNAHPQFNKGIQVQDFVFLDIKAMINDYWFVHFNEACESTGVEVLGQENLSKFKYSKFRASTHSHVKSGIDWFEVNMGVSFGTEKVKPADWIRALRNKESFVTLKDGSMGILPEEWLAQAKKILAVADVDKEGIKISKYRFNIVEDLFEQIDDKKMLKELKEKKQRLAEYDTNKKYKIPTGIKANLRLYQTHGFAWLKFLDESGFGGILADDMGLGKTLQVISLLADQVGKPPSLVIVPRSLLFNWSAELDKFCPGLDYVIHHGSGRSKTIETLLAYHIIITTYDTATSDMLLLKDFKFNYIILDESQAIKNPESKRYKAMRLLQSTNKIAMTGTPIQNNTFDLYAQLSFTSPGLLGSKTSFKNNFAVPIDNNGDTDAAKLLRKLIHPFLLRRTKEQVAKDLPDKTESIIYCEMGATQRKLYNNLKRQIKEDIEAAVEEKGLNKSKFQMLDGLLRLRQMCNSPQLLNSSFSGSNAESVKIDILLQNLTEELDQHNALVFSQFVSLLAIVRKELDKRGIKYAYLDGSTVKRQAEVEKFMNQDDIKIFLISLKAGNTGMNLTKADYVYILDPWWNPAAEAQAIDRTHRIGQDKQVFAYKLICKDSIEEKILKLQERKKTLAKDLIRTDENVLKSLDKQELMSLFD
ncbi:MAG: SNF2 family DNA or RNA helicase, partial [Saprospiraceae bacterium]